jgi:hypothetical protein
VGSDNPVSAENQQERPIKVGWVVGFVDGEGCFSISFVRQQDRIGRRGYKLGYQVAARFVVAQGASSRSCLEELQEFFGVGKVYGNRRHDNHREDMCQFVVSDRRDLLDSIVPFFERHPLRSAKREDFLKFAQILYMMECGRHLCPPGLVEIAEITQTMNRRKARPDLIGILRGHTPNIRDIG